MYTNDGLIILPKQINYKTPNDRMTINVVIVELTVIILNNNNNCYGKIYIHGYPTLLYLGILNVIKWLGILYIIYIIMDARVKKVAYTCLTVFFLL